MSKNQIERSSVVLLAAFLVAGLVSWTLFFKQYHQRDTVNVHLFPNTIGQWTATELPITDTEYAILETRNAFVRQYKHPDGREVLLFIVYSQNNRKVSHPPEICYTGSGATILNRKRVSMNVASQSLPLQANQLTVELGDTSQLSYYWFKVGDTFTPDYWRQQFLIAIKSLIGKPASSALIRVSANAEAGKPEEAAKVVGEFTSEAFLLLLKYLP